MPLLQLGEHLATSAAECGENHLCILDERQLQHLPDLQQSLTIRKSSTLETETSKSPPRFWTMLEAQMLQGDCQQFLQKQWKEVNL